MNGHLEFEYWLGENKKKEPSNVWTIFKNYFFENSKNRHGNIIYQKICFIFEISSYTFQVATTKFS
jgi:hypothetical protein